jgi:hypothetical protein
MPWIHFHSGDNGIVKACCVANIPYGNINDQSLPEIWEGEPINKIREKFLKGEIDKRCFVCLNREKSGGKSIRQETHEKYTNIDISEVKSPIYFDIRFSNVCNFKCRTCWHGASSKWFEDAKLLKRNVSDKAIIKNITDYNNFISKTGKALLIAKEIYFAGGEPLVTEEHYLLLNFLIENKATNIHLRYNTNFSKLVFKEYKVLELWKHFKQVEIMASVDDFEKEGSYIRTGFDWDVFLNNRKEIESLKNISFKVSPTVSLLNIARLPLFYKKLLKLKIIEQDGFYINLLERPYYYNVKAISSTKKDSISSIYKEFFHWCKNENIPTETVSSFKSCIDFMNEEDLPIKHWNKYLAETKLLDNLRK